MPVTQKKPQTELERLLAQVPDEVFVRMLNQSGMTDHDKRELAAAFRGLKG